MKTYDPADSKALKIFHRFVPSTDELDGQKMIHHQERQAARHSVVGGTGAR